MFKKWIKKLFVLTVVIGVVAGIVSSFLSYLPYLMLSILLLAPLYGVVRVQRNWNNGMISFFKKITFPKSATTYWVVGIVILLLLKAIFLVLAETLLLCVVGMLGFCLIWESVRWILRKRSISMISFFSAFKSAW
jgi:hypothetical protein